MFHLFLSVTALQQTVRSLSGFHTDTAAHVLQEHPTTIELIRIVCRTGSERGDMAPPAAKLDRGPLGFSRDTWPLGTLGLTDFSGSPLNNK